MMKNILFTITAFILSLGCSRLPDIKITSPTFISKEKFDRKIQKIVGNADIVIQAIETKFKDKVYNHIEITITSNRELPASKYENRYMRKDIAECIKTNLEYPNKYSGVRISFLKKTNNYLRNKKVILKESFKLDDI